MSFGTALQRARVAKGWDQAQLAKAIDKDQSEVSRYENNDRLPRPETVQMLEDVLGLPDGSLLEERSKQLEGRQRRGPQKYSLAYVGTRRLSAEEEARIQRLIKDTLGEP